MIDQMKSNGISNSSHEEEKKSNEEIMLFYGMTLCTAKLLQSLNKSEMVGYRTKNK